MRDDRLLAYVRRATRAYDGSHDAEHAERVARNAARLCARADLRDVCVAAALAHDTCDPKYVADKEASLEALRTTLRTAARLPDARARLVVDVVREVSYTKLRTRGPPRHLGADAYYAVGRRRRRHARGHGRRRRAAHAHVPRVRAPAARRRRRLRRGAPGVVRRAHEPRRRARRGRRARARAARAARVDARRARVRAPPGAPLRALRRAPPLVRRAACRLAQRRYWDAPLRTAFARGRAGADGDDEAPEGHGQEGLARSG